MAWVRLDDPFPTHRKVRHLSDQAFRLYVSALCWCNANLSDGQIPERELKFVSDVRAPKRYASELVSVGLWEETDSGWCVHDYLEYQPSAEKIREGREAKRARQERWLEGKRDRTRSRGDASQDVSGDVSEDAAPIPSQSHSQNNFSSQSSIPPYPARERDDNQTDGQDFSAVDAMVKRELAALAAHPITDQQAAHIRDHILSRARSTVKNPARYVQRALRANPHEHLPKPEPLPGAHRGVGRMCPTHPYMEEPCRACAADRLAAD
ncbi:hypothetical protein SAMN05421874_12859 [Nonomuraea maritima]|uniref:DUF1376 domain-containing protein n=1 Tax=Nonomuraea maritima TaxID=683260 RepID=A0A1G9MIS7_9ACTN|nr:hypothetical protein SAMN05421874_12859 [Nonomuraea maritima]